MNDIDKNIINSLVQRILTDAAENTFGSYTPSVGRKAKRAKDKPWFNTDCKLERKKNIGVLNVNFGCGRQML